jgi:hypothetical protein
VSSKIPSASLNGLAMNWPSRLRPLGRRCLRWVVRIACVCYRTDASTCGSETWHSCFLLDSYVQQVLGTGRATATRHQARTSTRESTVDSAKRFFGRSLDQAEVASARFSRWIFSPMRLSFSPIFPVPVIPSCNFISLPD